MSSSWRLRILSWFFVALFIVLWSKLFYWQVLAKDSLSQIALTQQQTTLEVPARRGEILFSDGSPLAANQLSYLAYLIRRPELAIEPLAEKLAPIIYPEATDSAGLDLMETRLTDPSWQWLSLGKKLTQEQKDRLDELGLDNLWFEPTQTRFYPEASLAAHLLGFVGNDTDGRDLGYYGLEGYYHRELSGRPGIVRQEQDALNQPIISGDYWTQTKKDGGTLKLNLNKSLQFLTETKLKAALERYGAKAGSVAVMDPYSGAILAMASLPAYDPAKYTDFSTELFSNPVVGDAFEPGSVFKVLVMAAALDSQAIKPETICDICDGPVKIDKYTINTWNNEYFPDSSVTDILVRSDNVGMVFVGQKLGLANFLDYFHRFGLTQPTGIDLEDELTTTPRADDKWTYVDLATASFGQGFLTTGMQLLAAVSAIANGGELVEPHLVEQPAKIKQRAIKPETAALVKDMMVAAAKSGEAKWVDISGYKIAGKTGTAQVAVGGKYASEKTNASFIGFAPADKPKFAMLVTLKEPSTSPWASETAAPLWFSLAQDLLNHFNVLPN
ncbi:MAG: penicillin-binding protein 2 [Candidatus Beckwithbacteria bacterium]|nr:penicillin-binding protein 2 [Candidatus Beckwithbacteria bacterium]